MDAPAPAPAPARVALRCGRHVDPDAVAAAVKEVGFAVDPEGAVSLVDGPPWAQEGRACVGLASNEAEALAAVRAGACDALVWPKEAPRLGRSLEAARHRASEAAGRVLYQEVFRRLPTWVELSDEEVVLTDVSRGFEVGAGYPRAEAVGRTPAELFRGGTHGPRFYQDILAALASDGAWVGDMLGQRRDGSLAVIEAHVGRVEREGRILGQFAVKRVPGRIAPDSLGGWVQGLVSEPWLLVQRDQGTVVEVGPRMINILGVPREKLLGSAFVDLGLELELPGGDEGLVVDRWRGERAYEVALAGRPVGDVELVLVVFRDVTERLRRQEDLSALAHDLQMARDQALAADRAKSAFLAAMSHELRTPLTAILGYAELLEDELEGGQAGEDLRRIATSGAHLLRLVDEVLDLARVESGEVSLALEHFPVRPLLEAAVEGVRMRAAAAGKEIVVQDVDAAATAWGDRQRVFQVVLNLVVNAVKYAVPGRIDVGFEAGGVFVQDQGPGLSAAEQVAIFHSFRQLEGGDGVGLGLAISRRLAAAMGGRLEVQSGPGEGSRFTLFLGAPPNPDEGTG